MARKRTPIKNNQPLVRELLTAMETTDLTQREICDKAGISARTPCHWREGASPALYLFEVLANAIGYDVKLVKKGEPTVDPIIVELRELFENYAKACDEARQWGGPTIPPRNPITEHSARVFAQALARAEGRTE
jgi:transcriptional regulator with XRE-family HTH domain